MSYDQTSLWQRALGAHVGDPNEALRERLRTAYELFRERVEPLAAMIASDLPGFTVHDIKHIDALWEYADLIAGPDYPLNPCEGFVLGGAILIHDLGMGLAAMPDGASKLKESELWKDTVAQLRNKALAKSGTGTLTFEEEQDVERQSFAEVLRTLHAERAEQLAKTAWRDDKNGEYWLIDRPELRDSFGPIIGRIAHSHWWSADRLQTEFSAILGAPGGFPGEWTVDPLKLAAILRTADYAHLDERRAPAFLRAIQRPTGDSENHWIFQGKLYQPRAENDRLVYTAKSGFSVDEAQAWWLCYDTLHGLDDELRQVDSLLADMNRARLTIKGVAQAESPLRLSRIVKADGWTPIDAKVRVSAIARLVEMLGGRELYGDTITPPLRELLQNAGDAIRARRVAEDRADDWGAIQVSIGTDAHGSWVQVEDDGVGMSENVLSGPLLDFGTSFWGSDLMHRELPGIQSRGFEPAGRYGIGFFSIFMWGKKVEVTSRRYDEGKASTSVLEFKHGLEKRPLLRKAEPGQRIQDGGTRVKVWLDKPSVLRWLMMDDEENHVSMETVLRSLACCSDVTINFCSEEGTVSNAVRANDWLTLSDDELRRRLPSSRHISFVGRKGKEVSREPINLLPLSPIRDLKGKVYGRAAIHPEGIPVSPAANTGVVTVGGYASSWLSGIEGVLIGKPMRAARDLGEPLMPSEVLSGWVAEQREAWLSQSPSQRVLNDVAKTLRYLMGDVSGFPVGLTNKGWITPEEVSKMCVSFDEVILIDNSSYSLELHEGDFSLDDNVIVTDSGQRPAISSRISQRTDWPPYGGSEMWGDDDFHARTLEGTVFEAVALGWNLSVLDLIAAADISTDEQDYTAQIGTRGSEAVIDDNVDILRRMPRSTS